MKAYLLPLLAAIQRQIIYRPKFFLWLVVDLSHVFVLPFIWLTIYADRESIASFSREDIVTYYIVLAFVSVATAAHHGKYLMRDILDGKLTNALTKPQHIILRRWLDGSGYNALGGLIMLSLIILFLVLFPEYLYIPKHISTLPLFFLSLLLANGISTSVQFLVGSAAFWMGESNALMQMRFFLEKVFSGEFAPIALYPLYLQKLAGILPFAFFYYIPIQIYLEKITGLDALKQLGNGLLWALFLWGAVAIVWRRGLRRYDGSGI